MLRSPIRLNSGCSLGGLFSGLFPGYYVFRNVRCVLKVEHCTDAFAAKLFVFHRLFSHFVLLHICHELSLKTMQAEAFYPLLGQELHSIWSGSGSKLLCKRCIFHLVQLVFTRPYARRCHVDRARVFHPSVRDVQTGNSTRSKFAGN